MNVRRLLLDVDKALARSSLLDIGETIASCHGVEAINIGLGDVDVAQTASTFLRSRRA